MQTNVGLFYTYFIYFKITEKNDSLNSTAKMILNSTPKTENNFLHINYFHSHLRKTSCTFVILRKITGI